MLISGSLYSLSGMRGLQGRHAFDAPAAAL